MPNIAENVFHGLKKESTSNFIKTWKVNKKGFRKILLKTMVNKVKCRKLVLNQDRFKSRLIYREGVRHLENLSNRNVVPK